MEVREVDKCLAVCGCGRGTCGEPRVGDIKVRGRSGRDGSGSEGGSDSEGSEKALYRRDGSYAEVARCAHGSLDVLAV